MGLLSASQRGELEIFIMLHSYSFHLNRKKQPLTALQLCPMATLWMQWAGADMSVVCVLRGGGGVRPIPSQLHAEMRWLQPSPSCCWRGFAGPPPPSCMGASGLFVPELGFCSVQFLLQQPPHPPAVGWMASADGWGLPEPWHLSPPLAMLSLFISHLLYVVVTKSGHVPR